MHSTDRNRADPVQTHVFLRIEHDTADPETVTSVLGVQPTHSAGRGATPRGEGEPYPWNVWVLSSAWAVQSRDCRAHFDWLVAALELRGPALELLRKTGYRIELHCVWVGKGGYGGPSLTSVQMGALAKLGVHLYFDVGELRTPSVNAGPRE